MNHLINHLLLLWWSKEKKNYIQPKNTVTSKTNIEATACYNNLLLTLRTEQLENLSKCSFSVFCIHWNCEWENDLPKINQLLVTHALCADQKYWVKLAVSPVTWTKSTVSKLTREQSTSNGKKNQNIVYRCVKIIMKNTEIR